MNKIIIKKYSDRRKIIPNIFIHIMAEIKNLSALLSKAIAKGDIESVCMLQRMIDERKGSGLKKSNPPVRHERPMASGHFKQSFERHDKASRSEKKDVKGMKVSDDKDAEKKSESRINVGGQFGGQLKLVRINFLLSGSKEGGVSFKFNLDGKEHVIVLRVCGNKGCLNRICSDVDDTNVCFSCSKGNEPRKLINSFIQNPWNASCGNGHLNVLSRDVCSLQTEMEVFCACGEPVTKIVQQDGKYMFKNMHQLKKKEAPSAQTEDFTGSDAE